MNFLKPGLPELPARIKLLPVHRGFPVPFFVAKVDGQWDFQIADPEKRRLCINHDLCWICGQPMGVFKTFVMGPVAAMNRITAEPASHVECAEFAVQACPFMVNPSFQRGSTDREEELMPAGGVMLLTNPGVSALWTSKKPPKPRSAAPSVVLEVGEPTVVRWYVMGREATRNQVLVALDAGIAQHLTPRCHNEGDLATVQALRTQLLPYLPRDTV